MLHKIESLNVKLFTDTNFNNDKAQKVNGLLPSFNTYLKNSLNEVNKLQIYSDRVANDFALGKTDNIHEVLIAGEKAYIALQFTMQIRNKILDAYNEIMRMQI